MKTLEDLWDARKVMSAIKEDARPLMLECALVAACGWDFLTPTAKKALQAIVAYGQRVIDIEAMSEALWAAKTERDALHHALDKRLKDGGGPIEPHTKAVSSACSAVVHVGALATGNYEGVRNMAWDARLFNTVPALVILNRFHGCDV